MKPSNNDVNRHTLDAELRGAVAADLRHKRVDDMKKRAILTASSYEEFRQLVACAETDQKPLSRKEMEYLSGDKASSLRRNGFAMGRSSRKGQEFLFGGDEEKLRQEAAQQALSRGLCAESVETYAEFDRLWRRCGRTNKERMELLLRFSTESIRKIFQSELNELGEIVVAVKEAVTTAEVERVVGLLAALSQAKGFPMAVRFLTRQEKSALCMVFSALEDRQPGVTEVIKKAYAAGIE